MCKYLNDIKCMYFYVCVWSCTWQIHWFSIFNSFMMVIFLVGLVSMILMRTLRKDYARYSKEEEMDDMVITIFTQKFWNTLLNEPYESHHLLIYTLVLWISLFITSQWLMFDSSDNTCDPLRDSVFLSAFYQTQRTFCFSLSYLYLTIRIVISVMNMDGSRFMVMCSGRPATRWYSLPSLALAVKSSLFLS